MFHKALWMRNYKITKPAVWALYLIGFFFLPFSMMQHANFISRQIQEGTFAYYTHSFNSVNIGFYFILTAVILASLIIGQERTNHSTDFTFSLPFSRKDIFLSKWMFGMVHIAASLALNTAISVAIYYVTVLGDYESPLYLLQFFLYAFLFLTAIYTFSMFVGTFSGNTVTQFLFSFIFLFLPVGLLYLIGAFLYVHFNVFIDHPFESMTFGGEIAQKVTQWTLPVPFFQFSYNFDDMYANGIPVVDVPSKQVWLVPFLYTAAALYAGCRIFSHTKNENNGRVLVFHKLKGFFTFSIAICFALLGGAFIGDAFDWYGTPNIVSYYIGMLIAGGISYIGTRKLLTTKTQQ